ncbi:hypothetical protein KP509_04G064900 [Ceratopteris richardii]|uniref:Protein DGS1, mitochondrial n=1 Tax=Ceratopteris richardii TaxID=49495 RepID=A0A8T2UXQ1_CERRI|nr:hypothetical protein KP509_04G064900 [Ceratopteris richardii]
MDSAMDNVKQVVTEWGDTSWKVLQRLLSSLSQPRFSFSILKRRRSRGISLPLPIPPSLLSTSSEISDTAKIILVKELLEEVANSVMSRIHDVHKNLQFWRARAEGTHSQKVKFIVLERGPVAFVHGISKLVKDCIYEYSPTQGLAALAASEISERTILLHALECRLALLLGEVYKQAHIFGESIQKGQEDATPVVLCSLHEALKNIHGQHSLNEGMQNDKGKKEESQMMLEMMWSFDDIPEELLSKVEWTDAECVSCSDIIRRNMNQLDDCLDKLVQSYRRPRRATRYWIRYTGSAVGLALVSGWLIQHSPLMGSRDIEIWLKQGGEAIVAFTKEHVEEPLMSIRDDLFETFRRRHHSAAELEDVQLTAASLQRMLRAFTEQLKGKEKAGKATEEEMMEVVMNRYEEEITHPLQNLLGGELFRAMLIQVQKLKLDIETAMLELNQILRANEINFAVLAALPALLFAMILGWLLRASLSTSKGAEGRGRVAGLRRRMLLAEVERIILAYQYLEEQGQEEKMPWHYGMIIYLLNQFYKAVERHAIASGEWSSLRGDILDLANPKAGMIHKLAITARVERIYECIVPPRPK